jgi:hypothetical protein
MLQHFSLILRLLHFPQYKDNFLEKISTQIILVGRVIHGELNSLRFDRLSQR